MPPPLRNGAMGPIVWSRNRPRSVFRTKTMDDIVNLKFNPGQGIAQFKSVERGLSMLVCQSRTPEEIEAVRDREAAEQLTRATRVLEEALKLSRGSPRAPSNNYFELKLNVNTFCALLHTLFGIKCGYYITLLRIRNCLDNVGVFNIREAYTPDICYRITRAIIDDGRSFFSHVMILTDFNTENVIFPESLLDSILPDMRYANPIMRASFPAEWQPHRQVPTGGLTLTNAATGGTGRMSAWTPPTGGRTKP